MNWCILIPLLVGLICAVLGYLLGKLLSNNNKKNEDIHVWKNKIQTLEADLTACKKSKLNLEEELKLCGKSKSNFEEELKLCRNNKLNLEDDLKLCRKSKLNLEEELNLCRKNKLNLESDLSSTKSNVISSFAGATAGASIEKPTSTVIPFDTEAAKAAFGKKIKQNDLKIVEGIGPKIEQLFYDFDIKTWQDLAEASVEKCQEVLNSGGDRYRIHKPGTWPKQAKLAAEGKWAELVKWQDELDGGK